MIKIIKDSSITIPRLIVSYIRVELHHSVKKWCVENQIKIKDINTFYGDPNNRQTLIEFALVEHLQNFEKNAAEIKMRVLFSSDHVDIVLDGDEYFDDNDVIESITDWSEEYNEMAAWLWDNKIYHFIGDYEFEEGDDTSKYDYELRIRIGFVDPADAAAFKLKWT